MLARSRRECAEVWAATERADDHPAIRAAEFLRLAPISRHEVARALATFPANTALTEGIGPHFLAQAASGLHVLIAALRSAAELVGSFPEGLRRVYVPLIPKAAGGHRPIQLYAILVRVWHQLRQPLVRSWRQRLYGASGWLNTRVGANPCDVVWRDAARAATLRPRGYFTLCVLSDIAKCFENVAWPALQAAAYADDYPSALPRLSVSMYAAPRVLMVGRATAAALRPTKGIGPGSAFATDELLLVLGPAVRAFQASFPSLGVSLHVDDVALSATGARLGPTLGMLARGFASIASDLGALGLPLAITKQQCVSSHPRAVMAMGAAFGRWGGSPAAHATRLGVDFGAGTCDVVRSSVAARSTREATRRASRRQRLRAPRGSRVKLISLGAGAVAAYGALVTGIALAALRVLARAAIRAAGASHPKVDPYVVMASPPPPPHFCPSLSRCWAPRSPATWESGGRRWAASRPLGLSRLRCSRRPTRPRLLAATVLARGSISATR